MREISVGAKSLSVGNTLTKMVERSSKDEEQIKAIKATIRKENPSLSEEEVAAKAFKIFNSKKKTKESVIRVSRENLKVKEGEDGEFYSEGFICTTHPDRAMDEEVDGEILTKQACEQIAKFINDGVATTLTLGSTRTVSKQHDWVHANDPGMEPAGMAMPPAEVKQTPDGQWGVFCKTHHNKSHSEFEDIKYKVEHGYYPGYSIEYYPGQSEKINIGEKTFRVIKSVANFVGYAFAGARKIANPSALITGFAYKEIEDMIKNEEAKTMAEEEIKVQVKEESPAEETIEQPQEEVVEEKVEEVVEESVSEEEPVVEKQEEEVTEEKPEEEEIDVKESKVDIKEVVAQIKESAEFKEAIGSIDIKSKVIKKEVEEDKMSITIKEMNEHLAKKDMVSYKEAASQLVEQDDWMIKEFKNPANYTAGFQSNLTVKTAGKGLQIVGGIKVKSTLGTGDNASTYTQADVEFADVFAPGIIDTFNNQTNLFGFLRKEQHIGGEHYQWKLVTNRDPSGNSTFVGHNDTTVAKNFSSKGNEQTPLKIARRGISVTDFINRYSARSLGDLFQLEVDLQMKEMMKDVNVALFAEVADGTGNAPLGLEAVADSAGNTTLYGKTRSIANRLAPTNAADTYLAVGGALTEAAMRTKISYLESEGVRQGDIAIIASPNSRDLLFNLLDGQRRFNTTEASFGFNRMMVPSYDGIPVIVDSDCNSDALYFIDTDSDVIVIGMEPRLVSLAKVGAATEAYVQMDFAHVYKQPRRIGMLDTLA